MLLPNEDINIYFLVAEVIDGISVRLHSCLITYGTNILKFNSIAFYSSTGGKKTKPNQTKHEKVNENGCCSYSTGKARCSKIEKLCMSTP